MLRSAPPNQGIVPNIRRCVRYFGYARATVFSASVLFEFQPACIKLIVLSVLSDKLFVVSALDYPCLLYTSALGDVEQSDLAVYAWSCNEAGVGERVADNHGRELCFVYVREEQRTGCCFYLWQVGFILHAIFLSKDFGHKKAHGLFRIHALFGCYSVVREFISLGRGRISGLDVYKRKPQYRPLCSP